MQKSYSAVESIPNKGLFLRVLVPVNVLSLEDDIRVLQVLQQVPSGLAENAEIVQTDELGGKLVFCPSMSQAAAETIYPLLLQAVSGPHVVHKSYVIVLRRSA